LPKGHWTESPFSRIPTFCRKFHLVKICFLRKGRLTENIRLILGFWFILQKNQSTEILFTKRFFTEKSVGGTPFAEMLFDRTLMFCQKAQNIIWPNRHTEHVLTELPKIWLAKRHLTEQHLTETQIFYRTRSFSRNLIFPKGCLTETIWPVLIHFTEKSIHRNFTDRTFLDQIVGWPNTVI
jgi:hypothetical protein